MKLTISHMTRFIYTEEATDSVNELRLTPFTNEHQSCYQHFIAVEPNAPLLSYDDYFGNRVHVFSVNGSHKQLTIRSQMTIVTERAPVWSDADSEAESGWEWLAGTDAQNRFAEYLLPTVYTEMTPEVVAFAADRTDGDERVFGWLTAISNRIRTEFVYEPGSTNVHTVVSDMIRSRRGVCQDFAHLMIAACRSRQVPARYVSGYHFVGDLQEGGGHFEQASHAWVEAFVPGVGWCGFDPTNDERIGERYVKLGHGRDYKDIVPVKGVYRGSGESRLEVKVDVRRMPETGTS